MFETQMILTYTRLNVKWSWHVHMVAQPSGCSGSPVVHLTMKLYLCKCSVKWFGMEMENKNVLFFQKNVVDWLTCCCEVIIFDFEYFIVLNRNDNTKVSSTIKKTKYQRFLFTAYTTLHKKMNIKNEKKGGGHRIYKTSNPAPFLFAISQNWRW